MNISCPKCSHKPMIWGNDWDNEDSETHSIWSQYTCPKCDTAVNIFWSNDENTDD